MSDDISTVPQLSREDLAGMKPAEIQTAQREGKLAQIMGQPVPLPPAEGQQISRDDLKSLSADEIVRLKAAGNVDDLLGRNDA